MTVATPQGGWGQVPGQLIRWLMAVALFATGLAKVASPENYRQVQGWMMLPLGIAELACVMVLVLTNREQLMIRIAWCVVVLCAIGGIVAMTGSPGGCGCMGAVKLSPAQHLFLAGSVGLIAIAGTCFWSNRRSSARQAG